MKRNIAIVIGLVLLLGAGIGWYFGSPIYTVQQMRSAADAGDGDRLVRYVDFPAVRESVKEQVGRHSVRELGGPTRGLAGLGAEIARVFADPLVDQLVTPEAVRLIFAQRKQGRVDIRADGAAPDLIIRREDFDHFELVDARRRDRGALRFTRHGLGWQLSEIRLAGQ